MTTENTFDLGTFFITHAGGAGGMVAIAVIGAWIFASWRV